MTGVQRFTLADGAEVPYVEFGDPDGKPFVVVAGLSDGLMIMGRTAARFLPRMYKDFMKYRVLVPQRRVPVPMGFTTADMGDDLAEFLRGLGAVPANVLGISMGGMVSQQLAARHPDSVDHLILGVTVPYVTAELRGIIDEWERMANAGEWKAYHADALRKTYTGHMPLKYKVAPLFSRLMPRPTDLSRYEAQSEACRTHDARPVLKDIKAPTLVLSGRQDVLCRPELGQAMAAAIPNAHIVVLDRAGHGAFEERKADFDAACLAFMEDKPVPVTR